MFYKHYYNSKLQNSKLQRHYETGISGGQCVAYPSRTLGNIEIAYLAVEQPLQAEDNRPVLGDTRLVEEGNQPEVVGILPVDFGIQVVPSSKLS